MKINLNFIPQNTALKGVKNIGLYDSHGNKLKTIPLGNLAPKSTGNILYTFGALSDIHLLYDTGPEDFIRALNYFNNIEKANFICISGDMGSTGVDSEWANFKAHVDAHSPNTPVHISAGNHDAGQSAHKTHDYPIPYTGNPLYYSFTQGDDVFIMFGLTFGGNPPFSKESLQWLYETLEENRNKRCFVFQHMMRKGYAGDASGSYFWDGLDNTNGKVFLSLMEHYKNVLWFHGHSHTKFNLQEVIPSPIANYDRMFGCHSIHVPSLCFPRDKDMAYLAKESEGYVVDVYENGIHLRGRDFVAEKFLPIASYWIDTTLTEIAERSYVDSRGVIDTEGTGSEVDPDSIVIFDKSEINRNLRYSASAGQMAESGGCICINPSVEPNTTYKLTYSGAKTDITAIHDRLHLVNSEGTTSIVNGNANLSKMSQGVVFNEDYTGVEVTFTTLEDTTSIWLSVLFNPSGTYIKNADELEGVVLTLEKVIDTGDNGDTGDTGDNGDSIVIFDKSEITLNERYSSSNGTVVETGGVISIRTAVKPNTTYKLTYSGSKIDIRGNYDKLYLVSSVGVVSYPNGASNIAEMTEGVVYNTDYTGVEVTFTTEADTASIWFSVLFNPVGTYISNADELEGVVLTLEKINNSSVNYTNLLPLSIDVNGNDFVGANGEDGYMQGYRINSSGNMVEQAGYCATGFIPLSSSDDIVRIANIVQSSSATYDRITVYNSSKELLVQASLLPNDGQMFIEEGNVLKFKPSVLVNTGTPAFIRFSTKTISKDTIVTINEVITKESYSTNVLPLAINADGTDFVGINGEDGYKTGYRLNWDHEEEAYQGACVSGYIPVKQSCAIRIKNIKQWDVAETDGSVDRIVWYDSNKAYLGQTTLMKTNGGMKMEDNNSTYKFSPGYWVSGTAFIRFSTGVINKNTIVTVNEPIFEPSEEDMD